MPQHGPHWDLSGRCALPHTGSPRCRPYPWRSSLSCAPCREPHRMLGSQPSMAEPAGPLGRRLWLQSTKIFQGLPHTGGWGSPLRHCDPAGACTWALRMEAVALGPFPSLSLLQHRHRYRIPQSCMRIIDLMPGKYL